MPKLDVNGRSLTYRDEGEGLPTVFLHGLGSRGADWQYTVARMKNHQRLIIPDLCGHGESAPRFDVQTIDEAADDVIQLLESLNLKAVNLVGFSLGGMLAFSLAMRRPDLVSKLVVINSGPGGGDRRRQWLYRLAVHLRKAQIALLGLPSVTRSIGQRLFPAPDQQDLNEQFQRSMAVVDKATYLALLGAIARFDRWSHLSSLQTQTLVIAADADYTPVSYKQAYTSLLTHAELRVVSNSRHATPLDQPDACAALIDDFLQP